MKQEMKAKVKAFRTIKGAKFVWVDKDGIVHYMSKEKFESIVGALEKGTTVFIKICVVNGVTLIAGGPVFAAGTGIAAGLQPIVDMIADAAEPICYGYFIKGFLKMAQSKEEEGKKVIKNAATGFLGVKFIPQIMKWLRGIQLFM